MALTTVAAEVYRDYPLDGVPSSGAHNPKKPDIRRLLGGYEQVINAFTSAGGLIYDNRALLDADLAKAANLLAWVITDATAANNGIYKKVGASGTGSWSRVADLPYSFIVAENSGAGTANAIQATSSLPVSGSALILLNIYETNGPGETTVQFNGGPLYTTKTNSGNDPAPGGLVSGMIVLGRVSGSTFRLVSDQTSAAIIAQAEAAAAEAVAAAAGVNLPAISPANVGKTLVIKPDGSGYDVGDRVPDGGVTDAKVAEPATPEEGLDAAKIKLDLSNQFAGSVVRLLSDKFKDVVSARDFGAYGLGNDYTTELQGFINQVMPSGMTLLVPTGEYGLSGSGLSISSIAGIPIENSGGANPIAKRSKFTGEGPGSTIFRHTGSGTAVTVITASSRQTHGNFSIVKNDATRVGNGLAVLETATMGFENVFVKGFDIGLYTRDDFSLAFYTCEFDGNRIGWQADYTTISKPNDFNFFACHWRNNKEVGAYVKNPVTLNLRGGTFEGNGSGNPENCALRVFGSPRDGSMGLNADGVYFEGNWGDADIIINNDNFGPGIHRLAGCTFNRLTAAKHVKNSVRVYRNSSQYMGVRFDANAFNNFGDYVPNASRKFVQLYNTSGAPVDRAGANAPSVLYDFNLFGNATETPV